MIEVQTWRLLCTKGLMWAGRGSGLAAVAGHQGSQKAPGGIFGASRAVMPPRVWTAVWVYHFFGAVTAACQQMPVR